ncbi:helix-turn-helix transcriptional regulator [Zhengella sp. ZM62]|uniref:helix-turn-helix transcriptional regulator n=1 Tax=Zhengella sedimenti TaxID=3390035 RepID=UPI003975FC51
MEDLLESIDLCLDRSGNEGWTDAFIDLVGKTGADQVMVFSYTADAAACLLSRNFRMQALGRTLGAQYLRGWFRQDPLHAMALGMEPGTLLRVDSRDVADAMSPAYRARFYDEPGLAGKTALVAAGSSLRLAVNLYHADEAGRQVPESLEKIIGRLALAHFEALSEPDYPMPLAVLSERERAVCVGILSGRKAEAIAGELGVAVTSVVTYRKRAYQKLGISSRGSLFALCGR